jgi:hypothetical protein
MGLKKAHDLVRKAKTADRLLAIVRFEWGDRMPPSYPDGKAAHVPVRLKCSLTPRDAHSRRCTPRCANCQRLAAAAAASAPAAAAVPAMHSVHG